MIRGRTAAAEHREPMFSSSSAASDHFSGGGGDNKTEETTRDHQKDASFQREKYRKKMFHFTVSVVIDESKTVIMNDMHANVECPYHRFME